MSRTAKRHAVALLLAAAWNSVAPAQEPTTNLRYRILARGAVEQEVDGRLWLYAAGWGWIDRVELGQVQAGDLQITVSAAAFPGKWNFAPHEAYLLAIETSLGNWYRSEMLVSPLEPPEKSVTPPLLLAALPGMLEQMGSPQALGAGAKTLTLAEQVKRRITLLHENGDPLAGETFGSDIYLWRQNHCGVAIGLGWSFSPNSNALGDQTTDAEGSLTLRVPAETLILRRRNFPVVDSENGTALRKATDVVEIPPGGDVIIRSRWEGPSYDPVSVRLVTPTGRPISGWYVDWRMNIDTCGPPIQVEGPSDADGWIHFETPIEFTAGMTVYDSDVREGGSWSNRMVRHVTREEFFELARERTATLRLEPPAR